MAWEWAPPTWEAVATFVAGIAAVVAAWRVGKRQTAIASRQADIQAEQTRIQEQIAKVERVRLRFEMYEQRKSVYDAARAYLDYYIFHGVPPRTFRYEEEAELVEPEWGIARAFQTGMRESRFLFRPEVHQHLQKVWKASLEVQAAKRRIALQEGRGRATGLKAALDKLERAESSLSSADDEVVSVFAPELTLGEFHDPT